MEQPKKIAKRKIAETQLCRAVLLLEDCADYISRLHLLVHAFILGLCRKTCQRRKLPAECSR
jgi:hypothetical protein